MNHDNTIHVDFVTGSYEGKNTEEVPPEVMSIALSYQNTRASLAVFATLLHKLHHISEQERLLVLFLITQVFPNPAVKVSRRTQELLIQLLSQASIPLLANYELCEWTNMTAGERRKTATLNPYRMYVRIHENYRQLLTLNVWSIMLVLIRLVRTDAFNQHQLRAYVRRYLIKHLFKRIWHRITHW